MLNLKNTSIFVFSVFITYFVPFLLYKSLEGVMGHALGMGSIGGVIGGMITMLFYTGICHLVLIFISVVLLSLIKKPKDFNFVPLYLFFTFFIDIIISICSVYGA